MRKEEESKPIPWEAADPKPPVIQSGHLDGLSKNYRSTPADFSAGVLTFMGISGTYFISKDTQYLWLS